MFLTRDYNSFPMNINARIIRFLLQSFTKDVQVYCLFSYVKQLFIIYKQATHLCKVLVFSRNMILSVLAAPPFFLFILPLYKQLQWSLEQQTLVSGTSWFLQTLLQIKLWYLAAKKRGQVLAPTKENDPTERSKQLELTIQPNWHDLSLD